MNWMTSAKNRVNRAKRKAEDQNRMMAWNKLPKVPSNSFHQYPNPCVNNYAPSNKNVPLSGQVHVVEQTPAPQVSRDVSMLLGLRRKQRNRDNTSQSSMTEILNSRMSVAVDRDDPMTNLQLSPSQSPTTNNYLNDNLLAFRSPVPTQQQQGPQQQQQQQQPSHHHQQQQLQQTHPMLSDDYSCDMVEITDELSILYFNDGHECNAVTGRRISILPGSSNASRAVDSDSQYYTASAATPASAKCLAPPSLYRDTSRIGQQQQQQQQQQVGTKLRLHGYQSPLASPVATVASRKRAQVQQQQQLAVAVSRMDSATHCSVSSSSVADTLTLFDTTYSAVDFTAQHTATPTYDDASRERGGLNSKPNSGDGDGDDDGGGGYDSNNSGSTDSLPCLSAESGNWWIRCRELIASTLDPSLATTLLRGISVATATAAATAARGGRGVKDTGAPQTRIVLNALYKTLSEVTTAAHTAACDTNTSSSSSSSSSSSYHAFGACSSYAVATRLFDIIRFVELVDKQNEGDDEAPSAPATVAANATANPPLHRSAGVASYADSGRPQVSVVSSAPPVGQWASKQPAADSGSSSSSSGVGRHWSGLPQLQPHDAVAVERGVNESVAVDAFGRRSTDEGTNDFAGGAFCDAGAAGGGGGGEGQREEEQEDLRLEDLF